MTYVFGFLSGFVACLLFLYMIGKQRHQGHGTKAHTGPSSQTQMNENVIPIVRKG